MYNLLLSHFLDSPKINFPQGLPITGRIRDLNQECPKDAILIQYLYGHLALN
jgi:hypothetical protein